jgi:phosphodiesterase/alkaline phosphatase D-like protein
VTILTMDLSRREFVAASAAATAALALERSTPGAQAQSELAVIEQLDFAREGWAPRWRTTGVANLHRVDGRGLLEAGSDVFPNDPRPVAFAADRRVRDAQVAATILEPGSAPGVVLRRVAPTAYYAAVYDVGRGALLLLRRTGTDLVELASQQVTSATPPLTLILEAQGAAPTVLRAELVDANGASVSVDARDSGRGLQRAGDPGVLATAETLFPSDPNPVLPALGNLHLLPWAVQEGQAFMATPVGQAAVEEIRRRSTAVFGEIVVRSGRRPRRTAPSVVSATTGRPVAMGAELHISTDLPVHGSIELSYSARFRRSWVVPAGASGPFEDVTKTVRGLRPGRRVYWRAHVMRSGGRRARGPVRSFRVPPTPASARPFRVAVAACGAQFGPLFEHLAARRPHVFVWQGDLNYPDTHGPLAQTVSGYAGIWRDFLANPALAAVFGSAAFAPQRDDHDYGVQDANATNIERYPWALEPWDALMNSRTYYRFPAGAAEVWVLDQRRFKTDPTQEDTPEKTLLGMRQRRWLLGTLARSRAPFKIVCSPCTVFMGANARDGNWGEGFTAERDLVVEHIRERVRGQTIFLTGDTHLTGVFDADGAFEARAAPVGIPKPNDITLVDPLAADKLRGQPGVTYASDENHLTLIEVRGGSAPRLDLTLVREDREEPYRKYFRGASSPAA